MKRLVRGSAATLALVLLAVRGHAQDVVGGVVTSQTSFFQSGAYTIINRDTPFNAAGQVTNVTAQFDATVTTCSAGDTFRVRVFRPNVQFGYSLVAERGPFSAARGTMRLTLAPPISVERGDLLALQLTGGGVCGVTGMYGTPYHTLQINGNYSGGVPGAFVDAPDSGYNFRASSGASALVGTLPGAGVVPGAAGSSFNTTLALSNPSATPIVVLLAYRAAGAAPDATPLTSSQTLIGNGSKSLKLTEAFPSLSGIGSIDVYTNTAAPIVNARVYNDTGSGTNGFTEALVRPQEVAHDRDRLILTIPGDLSAFRMNVGVRTFGSGATLNCLVLNADGLVQVTASKTIGANSTSLDALQGFFGGDSRALSAGGTVQCDGSQTIKSDLILYGTVTDNRTNDSAMFLADKR